MFIFSYLNDLPQFFIMAGIRLLMIFTIMPIHEYAHAFAAKKLGDKTAMIAGRLTLNPLAHVDPLGAVLLFVCGFGWAKPVPVNPRNFKNYKKGIAITSFAGPLSNLFCAIIGLAAFKVVAYIEAFSSAGITKFILLAIYQFVMINIFLAVFNLLPIGPLDGAKIFSCILPYKANAFLHKYETYITYGFFLLMILNVLDIPMIWLSNLVLKGIDLLLFWIYPLMRLILGA